MTEDPGGNVFEVMLRGGVEDSEEALRGARIVVRDRAGQAVWDEFDRGLHPWLLRSGQFAGKPVVLIGVRKTTIFDPVVARRPFIYSLRPGGKGLRKVWLGTSLSRPFVTADFANLDGRGDDELVALERTRSGGLSLGAYCWKGFGIEGIGRTEELDGAKEMRCGDVWGDAADEVVVKRVHEGRWLFEGFAPRDDRLVPCCEVWATPNPDLPVIWGLTKPGDGRPRGLWITTGDGNMRVLRFRATATTE